MHASKTLFAQPYFFFISLKVSILCLLVSLFAVQLQAQSVSVGTGSYSTRLPNGAVGPKKANGQNAFPKITSSFSQPIQTNDFWSSLIYPYFDDPHTSVMFAHPLTLKATGTGLQLGYTPSHVFAANDYLFPFAHQLTVGVEGLSTSTTLTESYGDWTVTARWEN